MKTNIVIIFIFIFFFNNNNFYFHDSHSLGKLEYVRFNEILIINEFLYNEYMFENNKNACLSGNCHL